MRYELLKDKQYDLYVVVDRELNKRTPWHSDIFTLLYATPRVQLHEGDTISTRFKSIMLFKSLDCALEDFKETLPELFI